MNANELATKVAAFIKHNNIDTAKVGMGEIVNAYFAKQMEAIESAGREAFQALA